MTLAAAAAAPVAVQRVAAVVEVAGAAEVVVAAVVDVVGAEVIKSRSLPER